MQPGAAASTPSGTDGRRRRRERSRAAAVDALLGLLARGTTAPSGREIADAAGLTERTLFNLFDDKAALLWAAVERFRERALAAMPEVPREGPLETRTRDVVLALAEWFDDYAALRWTASLQSGIAPELRRGVVQNAVFALLRELLEQEGVERLSADTESALRVAVSAGTWRQLRVEHELSRRAAVDAVTRSAVALIRDAALRAGTY